MKRIFFCLLILFVSGCQSAEIPATVDATSSLPIPSTTPFPLSSVVLFIENDVPIGLIDRISIPETVTIAEQREGANVVLESTAWDEPGATRWYYGLVGAFPTVEDGMSLESLRAIWRGEWELEFLHGPLILSEATLNAFIEVLGEPEGSVIRILDSSEIIFETWDSARPWALIPFEEFNIRLKYLQIDGQSLFLRSQDLDTYFLQIGYHLTGDADALEALQTAGIDMPESNFDPTRMTSLMMTGTTALVRSTAERMETRGINYPGEMIQSWLMDADLTHISNEVSFTPTCPTPDPWFINLQFCSRPDYLPLLEYVGADIIELTGNHLLDYGSDAMLYTLDAYDEAGIQFFGGGENLEAALQPLLIEDHNNRIAFLGCNSAGPEHVWATDGSPGTAQCDFLHLMNEVSRLEGEGYLVVLTLQAEESYNTMPMPWVRDEFLSAAATGASIVSGSQAHFPQGFEFVDDTIIHYGLGNLFFDQMDYPVVGTRREFYDRYVIYENQLISLELLTGMLEDYAQPRPMTTEERELFLQDYFTTSGW